MRIRLIAVFISLFILSSCGENDFTDSVNASQSNIDNRTNMVTTPIELAGNSTIEILVDGAYIELGAHCSNISSTCRISIDSSALDMTRAGVYNIVYSAIDESGNTIAQMTRMVRVINSPSPVIALSGAMQISLPLNSAYVDQGATCSYSNGSSCRFTIDSSSYDPARVGIYPIVYTAYDTAGNIITQTTRSVSVVDTVAPLIALVGDASVNMLRNSAYVDPGATCSDNYDSSCIVSIDSSNLDMSHSGSYLVTYNVTDANGNNATQVTRRVNVVSGNSPVITLSGANPLTLEVKSTYSDPGASATDNEDGNINVTNNSASTVNMNSVGSYTVTYSATDSQNNTTTKARTVNVVDTTAPVITLNGTDQLNLTVGDTYSDPGATALDNYDGDLSSSIVVNPNIIDTTNEGTHTVTYNVSDGEGNSAIQVTRTVNVTAATSTSETVYEDGINTNDWEFSFGSGDIASINETIRVRTSNSKVSYIHKQSGSNWNNTTEFFASYDIKSSSSRHEMLYLTDTDDHGEVYVVYTNYLPDELSGNRWDSSDGLWKDSNGNDSGWGQYSYVIISNITDGEWHHVEKDLREGLKSTDAFKNDNVVNVKYLRVNNWDKDNDLFLDNITQKNY